MIPGTILAEDDHTMTTSPPVLTAGDYSNLSKADHIAQLSEIDKIITTLLSSAGNAIKALAALQDSSVTAAPSEDSFSHEIAYLDSVRQVSVLLKDEVDGLRCAGIIADSRDEDGESSDPSGFGSFGKKPVKSAPKISLDVGILNSRSGKVGLDMEAELWAQARTLLEGYEMGSSGERLASHDGPNTANDTMQR